MAQQGGVNRSYAGSKIQKMVFLGLHFTILMLCLYLTLRGVGVTVSGLGGDVYLSDPVRAGILLSCAGLYFLRHGITLFYLLVRRVDWGEVFGLSVFILLFEVGLLIIGGGAFRDAPIPFSGIDVVALILLVLGSWLNTGSEIQRKHWKADSSNKGHCYTQGLFGHSMHINYFGDVVLFTGWCLFTASWLTLVLPIFMLGMFMFVHIPPLDKYLAERYGTEFESYRLKTKKLIPFVW
jgi:protein-S-isoprenylcysteine O-methyltransferase Ste14